MAGVEYGHTTCHIACLCVVCLSVCVCCLSLNLSSLSVVCVSKCYISERGSLPLNLRMPGEMSKLQSAGLHLQIEPLKTGRGIRGTPHNAAEYDVAQYNIIQYGVI